MKARLQAASWHLASCLAVAAIAGGIVFFLWYPGPFTKVSGGQDLLLLLLGADVTMGPLLTLLVFDPGKGRRHLTIDLTVIGSLQIAALVYGLHTVWVARPVHVVFEFDRFRVAHAVEVPRERLHLAPATVVALPATGPTLLALRPFRNAAEQLEMTVAAIGGVHLAFRPELWQPFDDEARRQVVSAGHPLSILMAKRGDDRALVALSERAQRQGRHLIWLPMLSRQEAWTVFLDARTAEPVEYLHIDSFEWASSGGSRRQGQAPDR